MVHTGKFKLDGRADPPVVAGLQMSDPDRYVGHGSPLAVTSFCYSLFDDCRCIEPTWGRVKLICGGSVGYCRTSEDEDC